MKALAKMALVTVVILSLLATVSLAKRFGGERGVWLGIIEQSVDYDLADVLDLDVKYGVLVHRVQSDSPADKAGIEDEDVIIALNKEKITDSEDLVDALGNFNDGDEVTLVIMRDNKKVKLKAVLENRPKEKRVEVLKIIDDDDDLIYHFGGNHTYIGVSLATLTGQLGDYFGVEKGRGALIREVEEDSPAEKAGLKAGDVIVTIDDENIDDADDVIEEIGEKDAGETVTVAVVRDNKKKKFEIEVGERKNDIPCNTFVYRFDDDDFHDLKLLKGLKGLKEMDFDHIQRVPGIDICIPIMPRHHRNDFDDFDLDEFEDEIKMLKKELKKLQKELKEELKEIHQKLD